MVSHDHKTIFVHIPKTAGQSVERLFLDDLSLSWEQRAPFLLRHNTMPQLGPEKLAHLYADEYVLKGHVTPDQFNRYYKFAIVRNPYDRCVSEFNYRWAASQVSFDDFLRLRFSSDYSDQARHLVPQNRYVNDSAGRCLLNDVFRFEELTRATQSVTKKIFGKTRPLPIQNVSDKRNGLRCEDLRQDQKDTIFHRFKEDFSIFGYSR